MSWHFGISSRKPTIYFSSCVGTNGPFLSATSPNKNEFLRKSEVVVFESFDRIQKTGNLYRSRQTRNHSTEETLKRRNITTKFLEGRGKGEGGHSWLGAWASYILSQLDSTVQHTIVIELNTAEGNFGQLKKCLSRGDFYGLYFANQGYHKGRQSRSTGYI